MSRRFRPGKWATLSLIIFAAITLSLARWQFSRAEQKREILAAYHLRQNSPPLNLADEKSPPPYSPIFAVGEFLPQSEILIDNRIRLRRPGYWVITPMRMENSPFAAAINRGWIAASPDRKTPPIPPPPTGIVTVRGILVPDNADAVEWRTDSPEAKIRQNLKIADLALQSRLSLFSLAIFRSDSPEAGLAAVAAKPNLRPLRNESYGWQWLSFAAAAAVIYAVLSFRKEK